jgi:hypothetical protein
MEIINNKGVPIDLLKFVLDPFRTLHKQVFILR